MLFDINAPVDLGSKAVTHSVDELKFAIKNSLPYNGLLSNYHSISAKGWPTTNGEQLSFVHICLISGLCLLQFGETQVHPLPFRLMPERTKR